MADKKIYKPIISQCKECGIEFEISPQEQKHMAIMGFELPKRCKECRKARRAAKEMVAAEELASKEKEVQQQKAEENEKELAGILESLPFHKTQLDSLCIRDPSTTLVVIGNGFDIMHGVKSSYWDFQKTIGVNSQLRFYLETYLNTQDLWANLEDSLGKLNYSMFLDPNIIDMWLDDFGAYDPDAQAADFFAAVETAIAPTFEIPRELNRRFKMWVKTLTVGTDSRPFSMLYGDYRVLSFNYTEFIEDLYGAKASNTCYIHGCRKKRKAGKPDEIILGHRPGMEEEEWDRVKLKPFKFKDPYKRYVIESALETAAREAAWYDESTTKKCSDIIKNHSGFFEKLTDVKEVYVYGHSLSEVDHPYFKEVCRKCNADWFIGYHSLDDMKRLLTFADNMGLKRVAVFRT